MKKVVTRFAPSPTGHLHIGGLRTALFNYLHAKAHGGEFRLRIEDTDQARNSEAATKAILQAFNWVGLQYDKEVIYQSRRLELYQEYIQKLINEGKAYYCYMSKEELDALRQEQERNKQTPRYDNRYRDFTGTPPSDVQPVVRIKAPLSGVITFEDGVKGFMQFQASEVDDFIIARSDGTPTYNFVVAIDDALMGITDVIRGDDHLSNTPKQIVVYQALGFEIPKFYHVPMILGSDGAKLSKRHGAMSVMEYKELGYLPEALLNFLVRLGWSYQNDEIFSLKDMLEKFDAKDLNTSPSCFNQEKFLWLNQHYLKETPTQKLESLLNILPPLQNAQKEVLFQELKNRSQTLIEFQNQCTEIFTNPQNYEEKMLKKYTPEIKDLLEKFITFLQEREFSSLIQIQESLHEFCETMQIKAGTLMPNLRLALFGKPGGIGIAEGIFILGKQTSLQRIQQLTTKTH
ncbi:glutamate--tRNA ligase [Helicobacter anatolicus]|uniref:glutamate--tRNA ligase n=1 Tax=Helicobacter anatolicus TaxID=2905874 RepID=UPI001E5AFDE2|nr:glutamate--tRNA ligase [Helicobacter anatolicus]MCE3040189.1 glutamate--tRNA ligase [Helicobacter anatolicus]